MNNNPRFGKQAVYLDGMYDLDVSLDTMESWVADGVNVLAPPMWMLLTVENGEIVPSEYAQAAKHAGLDIIAWTIERSGRIKEDVLPTKGTDNPSFYYQSTLDALANDGDIMVTLDVLAKDVGILGIFSDWLATETYYTNCMGLE